MKKLLSTGLALGLFSYVGLASAEEGAAEAAPAPVSSGYPKVGGHVGMAIPLVTIGDPTTGIGADFFKLGLAPGITVKLDDRWAVDFEFVAYSNFQDSGGAGNFSSLVIDPGLIYNFGFALAGLRAAMHIGGGNTQNFGVIPIILKTFPISKKVSFFAELDLPLFFTNNGPELTVQPQLGVGF